MGEAKRGLGAFVWCKVLGKQYCECRNNRDSLNLSRTHTQKNHKIKTHLNTLVSALPIAQYIYLIRENIQKNCDTKWHTQMHPLPVDLLALLSLQHANDLQLNFHRHNVEKGLERLPQYPLQLQDVHYPSCHLPLHLSCHRLPIRE